MEDRALSEFLLTTPPWLLVDKASVAITQAGQGAFDLCDGTHVLTGDIDGEKAILLFTDTDLAKRFATLKNKTGHIPVRPQSPQAIVETLKILQAAGCSKVVFDPGSNKIMKADVSHVIERYQGLCAPAGDAISWIKPRLRRFGGG